MNSTVGEHRDAFDRRLESALKRLLDPTCARGAPAPRWSAGGARDLTRRRLSMLSGATAALGLKLAAGLTVGAFAAAATGTVLTGSVNPAVWTERVSGIGHSEPAPSSPEPAAAARSEPVPVPAPASAPPGVRPEPPAVAVRPPAPPATPTPEAGEPAFVGHAPATLPGGSAAPTAAEEPSAPGNARTIRPGSR